ncbi:MAG: cobalamin-dependent protein, partial [Lentisphaerae bacterium]|nr:cobalamin-dependent protein [Lentisphaerota bacterium]
MRLKLIYPKWPKMANQPEFHLPPHAPVVVAAAVPDYVDISFCDENVQQLDTAEHTDLVAISCMLTCQIQRGWQIADEYRARGIPVIFGGIGTMLHAEETKEHADAVFIGEIEGRFEEILKDLSNNKLKKVYDYFHNWPDMNLIGTARRSILQRELYNFRGVQMVDLVHASRGCRFKCFPCCTPYLGGRHFRPRPIPAVIKELESIDNNRLFFVDNSMAQDDKWEKELFTAIAPLKKKWISHPIKNNPELLKLAADAGCWYIYQAIIDTSDVIRDRIKAIKDYG